jgi:hypothetical protein
MGGSISLKDRETLKYAIYDEFLSFVNQNRAELHHTSRSVQDAEQVRSTPLKDLLKCGKPVTMIYHRMSHFSGQD